MNLLQIENKAAKVTLDEVVDGESMGQLMDEIGQVFGAEAFHNGLVSGEITNCIQNAADTLDIDIHSPGGSVLDGYKLYNEILSLRNRGVHVTAHITLAASMASVIAMAADKVVMKQGGRMMIHEASGGAHGNAQELATQAALLESISEEIADIYAGKTGMEREEVRNMMKKETWLSADEAVALGFADSKFDTKKKTKSMNILDRISQPSSEEAQERIFALEASIESHDGQISEFQAKVEQAENALQAAATELASIKADKEAAESVNNDLEAKVSELESQVSALTEEASEEAKEVAEKVEELENKAEETDEKIAAKASEILAEQGHPQAVSLEDDGAVQASHLETYMALSGADATAYYKENGAKIRADLRAGEKS